MPFKSIIGAGKDRLPPGINSQKIVRDLQILASEIINASDAVINDYLKFGLEKICHIFDADRSYIYQFEDENKTLRLISCYKQNNAKEKIPFHEEVDKEDFSWLLDPLMSRKPVFIRSTDRLPSKANTIRAIMKVEKTISMLLAPVVSDDIVVGFAGLDFLNSSSDISDTEILLFQISSALLNILYKLQSGFGDSTAIPLNYKQMFYSMPEAMFISTPDGRFLDINPAGVKLFGYSSKAEMMEVDLENKFYLNSDDRIKYMERMLTSGAVKDYELVLMRKDGKKILVSETSRSVKAPNGKILYFHGILKDLTQKKPKEEEQFQAKKLESIGLLAGGIAHDFNNILTTISGYSELILMDMDPENKSYQDIKNILKGVKRAEDLIHQLLAFSRKQMIEPKVIDINEVIKDLHTMLSRLISEDIQLELNLKEDLSFIKADPVQIQQILVNLIVNANQAIKRRKEVPEKKFIRIQTENGSKAPEMAGSNTEEFIMITVEDNGYGMTEEVRKNIFEPFYSTKKGGKGTGLGLATVYGIVKQNNAHIFVDSEIKKGTIFRILWPQTDQPKYSELKRDTDIHFSSHNETILFVEDDNNVRELMCGALKSLGYTVYEAENGRIALELIEENSLLDKIDIVITDVVMPEMGGEDLANRLITLKPKLKILLCSGFTDSRVTSIDSQTRNGFHFLAKPYTIKKIEKKIQEIMEESTG